MLCAWKVNPQGLSKRSSGLATKNDLLKANLKRKEVEKQEPADLKLEKSQSRKHAKKQREQITLQDLMEGDRQCAKQS